ncbi:hypothetical protein ACNKHR_23235 [Shigella flexneri]
MARDYPQRPSLAHCMVFAGYVATPLFLSGLVALIRWSGCVRWSARWRCLHRLPALPWYPSFLNINKEEGLSFSRSTLAIGVLVLEVLIYLPCTMGLRLSFILETS